METPLATVLFSSYKEAGDNDDALPLDEFSINFAKIEFEYKVQKPDGSGGETVEGAWDLKSVQEGLTGRALGLSSSSES